MCSDSFMQLDCAHCALNKNHYLLCSTQSNVSDLGCKGNACHPAALSARVRDYGRPGRHVLDRSRFVYTPARCLDTLTLTGVFESMF